jgi:hypothetical protein
MVSREAAKAHSPRRKPWATECLRELSREAATAICAKSNCCRRFAANTLRGKHNPWANAQGYVLSPLRGYKLCIVKNHAAGFQMFGNSGFELLLV